MNAERLLQHYEQIADAPDAIARLRRFILDLAVRGKLVPQDFEDEPASVALKRINARGRPDGAFTLPASWAWIDVAAVAEARLGKMLDKAKNKGVPRPYLRNINVRWFDFDLSDLQEMPFEDAELAEFALRAGDVLICEGGEPGRAAVWDERARGVYFQKAIHRVRFTRLVDSIFFVYALKASANDGRLAESFTGTGIKHFTGKGLSGYRFPLPPLGEQHRIVAKVDELMALCDALDAARTERETKRDRLAAASLARLNTPDPETFCDDARFALDALPALTARPDQIKPLRQTILNLAVRGKLVPQDPADEPAAELLLKGLKARDLTSKRTANSLEQSAPQAAKVSPLPDGWVETLIDHVAGKITDGEHFRPPTTEDGVYFLSAKDIREEGVSLASPLYVSVETAAKARARCNPEYGDILIVSRGATCGRVCVVDVHDTFCLLGSVILLKLPKDINNSYVAYALRSQSIASALINASGATAQGAIYLRDLKKISLPLPPLAEQHRIVAKVDELMALCDELETSLTGAEETRKKLLDALLAEALAPVDRKDNVYSMRQVLHA